MKYRAMRMDMGNFSWGSESVAFKTRIIDVLYNATNNELVRTKTLVKNAIIQVDGTPFKLWYIKHYGVELGKKKVTDEAAPVVKKSKHLIAKQKGRAKGNKLEQHLQD